MEDRLKTLAKSVSDTGSPVEVFLDDVRVDLGDGSSVDVEGTLSITPSDAGSVEEVIEDLGDGYEVRSGGVKLHCSDKETCRVELVEEDKVVLDVRRASLFKDFLTSMRGGGGEGEGNPLASLSEKGFTLKVKYKGMTLLRNADPESLMSFMKKL